MSPPSPRLARTENVMVDLPLNEVWREESPEVNTGGDESHDVNMKSVTMNNEGVSLSNGVNTVVTESNDDVKSNMPESNENSNSMTTPSVVSDVQPAKCVILGELCVTHRCKIKKIQVSTTSWGYNKKLAKYMNIRKKITKPFCTKKTSVENLEHLKDRPSSNLERESFCNTWVGNNLTAEIKNENKGKLE